MSHNQNLSIATEKHKIDSFCPLRVIAFTMVFLRHVITEKTLICGSLGVSIFLVLSGFLMTYNYYDKLSFCSFSDVFKFAIRKIKKIYPLHILTTVLTILLFPSVTDFKFFTKVLANLLLINAWIPDMYYYYSFNIVSWYLSVCFFCYFAFPYILHQIKKYRSILSPVVSIILTLLIQTFFSVAVYRLFPHEFYPLTYIFPLIRLGDFMIGCQLGVIFMQYTPSLQKVSATILEIIAFLLLLLYRLFFQYGFNQLIFFEPISFDVIFIPLSILFVYLFAIKKGIITSLLTNRFFIFVGNVTGDAFLIHYLVIKFFRFKLNIDMSNNKWLEILILYIVSVFLSVLYKKLFTTVSSRHKAIQQKSKKQPPQ